MKIFKQRNRVRKKPSALKVAADYRGECTAPQGQSTSVILAYTQGPYFSINHGPEGSLGVLRLLELQSVLPAGDPQTTHRGITPDEEAMSARF